ncbi:probable thiopurine S-methyltransferase isoform X1 [Argopecten irradians]|uniref:probable thiopurine S-methyltransferase isoform X1 n=1 Tax=Argopecten irradians TaxID=31199 RepID=UPI0037101F3D
MALVCYIYIVPVRCLRKRFLLNSFRTHGPVTTWGEFMGRYINLVGYRTERKISGYLLKMASDQIQGWLNNWESDCTPWHMSDVHEGLANHYDILVNKPAAKNKIFVPLCGKSVDIKWLADRGNEVVGVEAAEMGLVEFFTEQNIEYSVEEVPSVKGKLFRSRDNKIRLYFCDIFDFSADIESGFSGVWDRGSMEALEFDDRKRYFKLMKSLISPDTGYLSEIVERDLGKGPPYCVTADEIEASFGSGCKVTKLMTVTKLPEYAFHISDFIGLNVFSITFH